MRMTIHPSKISGKIHAPASKSSMQRACAASLVRKGVSVIHNAGISNDDKAAIGVIKALGAEVRDEGDHVLRITSNGVRPLTDKVNCGESGLGIRMFAPIIALSERQITVQGEGSLLNRPMDFFDTVLPLLDVRIESNNGRLPLTLLGPLHPRNIEIDGSLSSQFLTGLLFAYAAAATDDVTIRVNNLKSRPYVDLTLIVMEKFGLPVPVNTNYEAFRFAGNFNKATLEEFGVISYTVEGDWSGGAFLLVAGAIAGNITVRGLDLSSTQADKKILQALADCKSNMSVTEEKIDFGGAAKLSSFHFDATDCPDLFPPLVALASFCNGTTMIEGVHRLTHKESNRALTLQEEFAKMGVTVKLDGNTMLVTGGKVKGAVVHSRHDHRIAMACAIAALNADGETTIEEAEAVNKSYPDFYDHLESLGANVYRQNQLVKS